MSTSDRASAEAHTADALLTIEQGKRAELNASDPGSFAISEALLAVLHRHKDMQDSAISLNDLHNEMTALGSKVAAGHAINVPFRLANQGQQQTPRNIPVRRSGPLSSMLTLVPKLNTRVRFPSSALLTKPQVSSCPL
ncbi:hypothetical protein [Amycolatopsis xylanica]|uniref:hypothetical protein n=1 Tax=Amycolatopsis xylanica TaxID=589385 RepID=UPI00115F9CE3|nr:hypothetical protein [Amycolatopsis xylanica]